MLQSSEYTEAFLERQADENHKRKKYIRRNNAMWISYKLPNISVSYSEQCTWTLFYDQENIQQSYEKAVSLLQRKELPPEIFKLSYAKRSSSGGTPLIFYLSNISNNKAYIGYRIMQCMDYRQQTCGLGYPKFIYCKRLLTGKRLLKIPYNRKFWPKLPA
jgi:hypothetical protein